MKTKLLSSLFKPLEKLIIEHGSATILREHLALFKTQLAIAEKKIQILETDNQQLSAEINELRTKIQDCENRNKKLLQTITKFKEKQTHKIPPRCQSHE